MCVCVCVRDKRGVLFIIGRPRSRGRKDFGSIWTGGGVFSKLDKFRRRHICIVPNFNVNFSLCSKFEIFVLCELIQQMISLIGLRFQESERLYHSSREVFSV